MKKISILIVFFFSTISIIGQNPIIIQRLRGKYKTAEDRHYSGWYKVSNGKGKVGACDLNGNEIIPPIWDDIESSRNENYARVFKNGKMGIRDASNKELLACDKYTYVYWSQKEEYGGYCIVEVDGQRGVIDKNNIEIIPCKYDEVSIHQLTEMSCCRVSFNSKKGLIDSKGNELFPCIYDKLEVYSRKHGGMEYYVVKINGKSGIYSKKWEEIIPCKYDEIKDHQWDEGDFCEVQIDEEKGIIDRKGNEMVSGSKYGHFIFNPTSALVVVIKGIELKYGEANRIDKLYSNGRWGIFDLNKREEVVPCKYDYIRLEDDGLFAFNVGGKVFVEHSLVLRVEGGKWGFVNKKGEEVVPAQYDYVGLFENGVVTVKKDGVPSLLPHPSKGSNLQLAEEESMIAVDNKIPNTSKKNENAFAFIVSNENYTSFTGANYSINDGTIFAEYCKNTLGLPEKNVRFFEDATYGNMVSIIKRIKDIADVYEGEAKIIFYYSGLGAVDEKNKEKYLLPTDASLTSLIKTGYCVETLIKILEELNVQYTWVILEAPFSNIDKNGKNYTSNRGVAVKTSSLIPQGNVIVSYATSDMHSAYSDKQFGHGLFTYGLLEKMQQSKGCCTLKELLDYAVNWVKKVSIEKFDNMQTPETVISKQLEYTWDNLSF